MWHFIIEWFIYFSLMPYMPPPTSWNPVPHIYFLTWNSGGGGVYLSMVQRMESSPPMTSCSLRGALPFDVTLCRNRRQHKENNIIWGSLGLGSRGRRSNPLLSLSVNRETWLPPTSCLSWFSFHGEKVQLSIFTCAPWNSSSRSCILLSITSVLISYPFSP